MGSSKQCASGRRSQARSTRVALGLLALLLPAEPALAQSISDPNLSVSAVVPVFSLAAPTTMAFLGPDDILVLEKNSGNVQRILNGTLLGSPVLTVNVDGLNERGLLGIAVNTETPRKVFLYFSEAATQGGSAIANRVYRYTWNANTGQLESPQLVLDLPVLPGANHNGGVLLLGPTNEGGSGDGSFLYVSIGDLNHNGQLQNNATGAAPDDTSVILRVRQDGTPAAGNPFTPYCTGQTTLSCDDDGDCGGNGPCRTMVARYFAYGMRNAFGLTRDAATGRFWLTENGPGNYDEVNRLVAGMNGGWNQIIGPVARDAQGTSNLWQMPGAGNTYRDPEFSLLAPVGITGIVFPRGSRLGGAYDDVAIFGEVNSGQLFALPLDATRTAFDFSGANGLADRVADSSSERDQFRIGTDFSGITDLKIGPDQRLYVVSIYDGTIYRIDGPGSGSGSSPSPRAPDPDLRELGRSLGEAASEAAGGQP